MDTKEWMTKYLAKQKSKGFMLLLGIAGVLLGIFVLPNTGGDAFFMVMALLWLGGGCYLVYNALNGGSTTKNWISMMEREGRLQNVLSDFRDAMDCMGGELRLGQRWIYGKGSGIPYEYGNVVRVYQYVHKTNFAEDSRQLHASLKTGGTVTLCDLPVGGAQEQELNRALGIMLHYNPNIQIGYKK